MEYTFEYVLLDRDMVHALIKALHRPEPSGYGTLPGENMNVAWGVLERNTQIILTKGYEPDRDHWQGEKGVHQVGYDVMSLEGCFGVGYETDAQGNGMESATVWGRGNTTLYQTKYLEVIKQAILFYEKAVAAGNVSTEFKTFAAQFELEHFHQSLADYSKQTYQEVYDFWQAKWK